MLMRVDPRARGIAQPDRLGALREAALLARLDEGEAAFAAAQEFGGAGAVGEAGRGAGEEYEARLVVARRGRERAGAAAVAHDAGQRHAREQRRRATGTIRPNIATRDQDRSAMARSSACSAPSAS